MAIGTAIFGAGGSKTLSKQAWGTKRQCPNCGARFYDLMKDPIVCPKCQTVYEPEASKPPRRGRPAPVVKKPTPVEAEIPDVDLPVEEVGEEEEEVLEDASELGEDEDDVAEVIEKVDEGEER
jgi:uncharacterized protein (TIGR02300 family)